MRRVVLAFALILGAAQVARAHDMFWTLTSWFVAPNSDVRLFVLNGTFSKTENSIGWERVADLSVVSPAGRATIDSAHWETKTDTSVLRYTTAAPGTYVTGLSTKPRELAQKAADFNTYLKDDGIPDIIADRTTKGQLGQDARERYHKHVKAIIQVGDARTDGWKTVLGYPAELVPLANPYTLKPGATLAFRCLVDGKPAAHQLVMVGGRSGAVGDARLPSVSLRSDADGIVRVQLTRAGRWYVKFIHMTRIDDGAVNYESKWASLTFEVRERR
ncbi:DUF4198 domain-containing protein [bacterium]|jgi:uncharacterized GH25 family protein|nr:DUF4198 domain-containing protein [bacterium]